MNLLNGFYRKARKSVSAVIQPDKRYGQTFHNVAGMESILMKWEKKVLKRNIQTFCVSTDKQIQ